MVKCTCINDENRPKEIPISKWLKKDKEYHIIWVYIMRNDKQNGIQGCDLAEISLDESNLPYECFQLSRFAISEEDMQALIELAQECSGLDKSVVEDLIKETKIQVC